MHSAFSPCINCPDSGCCLVYCVPVTASLLIHLPGTQTSAVSPIALKRKALLAGGPAQECCALQLCTGFKGCDLACKSELIPGSGRAFCCLQWDKEGFAFPLQVVGGGCLPEVISGNPLRCDLWFCFHC